MFFQLLKGDLKMGQHMNTDIPRRMILACNIKDFVIESKKTQVEIAKAIGVTTRQLVRYMNGTSEPTAVTLYALAKFLDVSFQRFIMSKDEWWAFITEIYENS
jgi:transcriptional regulator with XRE-family HTH domain